MEEQPGPSNLSLVKVNPRGKLVGSEQKVMIINLCKQIKEEQPTLQYRDMIKTISQRAGVGQRTISKTLSQYKKKGCVTSPNRMRRRLRINEKTSEENQLAIRRKVHEFWFRREMPNLDKILMAINDDKDLPTFSKSTLYRLLKKMAFKFVVRSRNSTLIDKDYITLWRQKYLLDIKQYHKEGRQIYYLGATSVNVGDSRRNICVDKTSASIQDATERHLSTGIHSPMGKGKRLIVGHIGSLDGFVPGALLLESKKDCADYHELMNEETFFKWFIEVLPKLKKGSIIVMGHEPYNSMQIEKYPTMLWKKFDIIAWMVLKGIKVPAEAVKVALVELAEKHKKPDNNYVIDVYAKQQGLIVLRIPLNHCGLNPIELAWAMVKDDVKAKNTTYKLAEVNLTASIESVSADSWKNFIQHTTNEETRFLQLDHIIDDLIDEGDNWTELSDTVDIPEIEEEDI